MQSLNLIENRPVEFNAFKIFNPSDSVENKRRLNLLEQLQVSLCLDTLLNIFAREASKYVDFSGLYFKSGNLTAQAENSRTAKAERQFELRINGDYLGTLTYNINRPISMANFKILSELHQALIHPINNAVNYQKALVLALEDQLTSLGNRRAFDQQLKRAIHHANRNQSKVGLILCDLNKFKQVNDTYGHHVGDEVLIQFAQALKSSVRESDSVFRFGGDEFAIIVEEASFNSLEVIEARLANAIKNNALLSKYKVSGSLGYTFMNRTDNEHSIFQRADTLLYRNKVNMHSKKLTLI